MGKRLFVGNLAFDTQDADLRELFSRAGAVVSASIVIDRATARSRGFGFVEMGSEEEARRAVSELSGAQLQGRAINVSEARERGEAPPPRPAGSPRPGGPPVRNFGPDLPPMDRGFRKNGKSRRGVRGRKRSIY